MKDSTAKAIIGAFGCTAIGVACYVTQSGAPLWGLFLLAIVMAYI
jgi:hypothetical protein